MFTGLVEGVARVTAAERRGQGLRLAVAAPAPTWEVALGDSVAVSGACLTVSALRPGTGPCPDMEFDLSGETLARTWLGGVRPGDQVNLERAVRASDRLGGHLVSGHVDGLARVLAFEDSGDGGRRLDVELAPELARYLVEKGSITLDGVSLTVVEPRGASFWVALIPETLARTTLGGLTPGRSLHVEVDAIGKWVERLMAAGADAAR